MRLRQVPKWRSANGFMRPSFQMAASGPTILNLGCGTKTSPRTVNIDFSIYQRIRKSSAGKAIAVVALRGERREQFDSMDDNVLVHDLRKGIPAADNSVDAVYHSHTLEHVDRDAVPAFLAEILRVLVPEGSTGSSCLTSKRSCGLSRQPRVGP